jgi:hypothetical protein
MPHVCSLQLSAKQYVRPLTRGCVPRTQESLAVGEVRLATDELSLRIGRREVTITHPRKMLFPDDRVTKEELVDYYRRVAKWMLPHMRGRPVAMERYPDGIDKPGFFQKDASLYPISPAGLGQRP